jgi:hypothetical protein
MPLNRGIASLADAVATTGQEWMSFFFKTGVPAAGAARWVDGSVGAGIPIYNPYVGLPLEATVITGAGNRGIYTGPTPATGQQKFLHAMQVVSVSAGVPLYMLLADYLLFYPLIDGDSADTQTMVNTDTLSRYTSGEGVQCMFITASPMGQNGTVTVTYTNSAGVSGRTTTFGVNTSTTIGCIVNTGGNTNAAAAETPFMPLANGDSGVRSIESVIIAGAPGGLFNAVLVKPLSGLQVRENATAAEKFSVPHSANCPEIQNAAYLNWIINNATATTPLLRGYLHFVWS